MGSNPMPEPTNPTEESGWRRAFEMTEGPINFVSDWSFAARVFGCMCPLGRTLAPGAKGRDPIFARTSGLKTVLRWTITAAVTGVVAAVAAIIAAWFTVWPTH